MALSFDKTIEGRKPHSFILHRSVSAQRGGFMCLSDDKKLTFVTSTKPPWEKDNDDETKITNR